MAPHPPNHLPPREALIPSDSNSNAEIQIQETVNRALSLNSLKNKPIPLPIQNRQATVTVIGNPPITTTIVTAPTTTIITSPPAATSPVDNSDQTVESGSGGGSNLNGGAIAGIVIGSIVGLLLLIWIIRSCTNLGAPPTDTPPRDGRAWYDGVRSDYPPPESPRSPYRHSHAYAGRHHHHGSRSRSRHSHRHHRRSGSIHVAEVQQVQPVAVVRSSSRRGSRSPYRAVYEDSPSGHSHHYRRYEDDRGRSRSRSHSRRRYE